ncbi:MAG TPA: glycosyl hydrolase 53 family protein [Rhodothermales bacterium]
MKRLMWIGTIAVTASTVTVRAQNADFYFGNDLSYVNQMEDCGAVFKDGGEARDVYRIYADRGANLVSVRLWLDPSWWQGPLEQPEGVKPFYNDIEDVRETIRRSKEAGMEVMLGFHYSDFWADPNRQLIPRTWQGVARDVDALADSVYRYTKRVLTSLNDEGLMPEFVKVGNEVTSGLLMHLPAEPDGFEPGQTVSRDWSRHARLFNAGIRAVREVGATASIDPKIVIHFAEALPEQQSYFDRIIEHGVTDFDVVGISYYFAWHGGSIPLLETTIRELESAYPDRDVMVIETAYPWTTRNYDRLGNIVGQPDPDYVPISQAKQLEYLTDYARAVMRGGGSGVIFWESAWVTTPCRTPWGQGSSHEHVAFFDPVTTDFLDAGGGRWMERHFYEHLDAPKVTFTVELPDSDPATPVFVAGSFSKGEPVPMGHLLGGRFAFSTYLPVGTTGTFHFLRGAGAAEREVVPDECAANGARSFEVRESGAPLAFAWGSCEALSPAGSE